jgi:hypothetical protein
MPKPRVGERRRQQALLKAAQEAQHTYWDALSDLETAMGLEIDLDGDDLDGYDLDSLYDTFAEPDADEEDEDEINAWCDMGRALAPKEKKDA